MPDQPQSPKPENVPTYEDVEKELGMDMMSFMSEMLSEPSDTEKRTSKLGMNQAQNTQRIGNSKKGTPALSPRERQIIDYLEKEEGRKLTQQEVNLALDSAEHLGNL